MDDIDLAGTRAGSDQKGADETRGRSAASIIAAVVATALIVAWVLRNGDSVRVDWLFGSTKAPLAIVIIVAAVMGWVIGTLTMALMRRRRSKRGGKGS